MDVADVDKALDAAEAAERAARSERGLPTDHVLDLDQFPFAFACDALEHFSAAAEEWARVEPNNAWTHYYQAFSAAAHRDYAAANAFMEALAARKPGNPRSLIRFGTAPEADVPLPPVQGEFPKERTLFLGCSGDFLREFGVPLLRSMADHGPGSPVHIHVMYHSDKILREVMGLGMNLRLSASYEDISPFVSAHPMERMQYYGAVRFIRFAEALEVNQDQLWICDVDSLFVSDPRRLFEIPGDVAIRVRPGRIPPWHQFSACLVKGTPASRSYFRSVAGILKATLTKGMWGFDQYALFSAWIAHKPNLTLLGPREIDIGDYDRSSLMWFTAGNKKKLLLVDQGPYPELFRRYRAA